MAEELAFQEAGGKGCAIEGDEGPRAATAEVVHGLSQRLLAGTSLAMDDDGAVGPAHHLDVL